MKARNEIENEGLVTVICGAGEPGIQWAFPVAGVEVMNGRMFGPTFRLIGEMRIWSNDIRSIEFRRRPGYRVIQLTLI